MATITIISFGYGHPEPPPPANVTIDVRDHFRDPHVAPTLREKTATDPEVIAAVVGTPGVPALIDHIIGTAEAFETAAPDRPVTIAVGCVGGRHRSATIAAEVARRLEDRGAADVQLYHRDMHRPVIVRASRPDRDTWTKLAQGVTADFSGEQPEALVSEGTGGGKLALEELHALPMGLAAYRRDKNDAQED